MFKLFENGWSATTSVRAKPSRNSSKSITPLTMENRPTNKVKLPQLDHQGKGSDTTYTHMLCYRNKDMLFASTNPNNHMHNTETDTDTDNATPSNVYLMYSSAFLNLLKLLMRMSIFCMGVLLYIFRHRNFSF